MSYQLAQVNVARLRAPIDDPLIADFVAALAPINALAERSPGFVWRLTGDGNDATSLRVFDNDAIIVNLSVWESVESLYAFAHDSEHVAFFRRRREWFERMSTPAVAMWWVPSGHIPTTEEARAKLEHLERHGPTPQAFTFKQRFAADSKVNKEIER